MSGRLFALALIGVLISASNWVYSEETREAQEAQNTEPAQPPDPTASGSQDEEHEEDEVVDAAADVFVPTEQISEDAAVPFPVDI